jgi:hypothetical protein
MFGNDVPPIPPTGHLPHAQCPRCKRVYVAFTPAQARAEGMDDASIAQTRSCHVGCGGPADAFRMLRPDEAERAIPAGCTINVVVIDRPDEAASAKPASS